MSNELTSPFEFHPDLIYTNRNLLVSVTITPSPMLARVVASNSFSRINVSNEPSNLQGIKILAVTTQLTRASCYLSSLKIAGQL